jgi:uncharacterized membrane protein
MKTIGLLIIALAVVSLPIILAFTLEFNARGMELHKTCPLDEQVCPYIEIPWQPVFLIGIAIIMIIAGVFVYKMPEPKIEEKHRDTEKAKLELQKLEGDEKIVFGAIIEENGMIFQSKLIQKTNMTKVKISRILDSLEDKQLVERKRRGMTNVVVLK